MNPKELRGLYEAYSEVYVSQEKKENTEVVDEGKLPLNKERRDRIGRQIGRRTYSSSPKKYDQMDKMSGALKSAQKKQNNEEFGIDEAVKGEPSERRKALAAERRAGDKPLPKGEGEKYSKFKASQISYIDKKTKGKYIHGMTREDLDIFDTVLEFLQTEGFAETLEDAEFIMANDLNAEVIDAILEARKSYSATAAKAGKDIGKKGKIFGKIAREAGERYGSAERGKKVAGAILAKLRAKHG